MKKKLIVWALVVVMLATILAGCGSSKESYVATDELSSAAFQEAAAEPMDYGAYEQAAMTLSSGTLPAEAKASNTKIIHTAELDMETTDFDAVAAAISRLTEDCGGYFEQSRISGGSGYRAAYYIVRVPAESFRSFLSQTGELGHLLSSYEYAEDVSEAYYDADGRLATQQAKLSRLQGLLADAKSMKDIITLEEAIAETEEEIDRLSGRLRRYDALVDYATITIWLDEVYRLSNVEEPVQGFGSRLASAFSSGWQGFLAGMEGLAITLAYSWLWLVLIIAVVMVLVLLCRRHRKRRRAKRTEQA